jgi:hypothetical protein
VTDDQIEPRRSPRPRRQRAVIEALGENTSTAQNSVAAEAARHDHKPNLPRRQRQIGRRRLWIRLELAPHPGQRLVPFVGRTLIGRGAITEGALKPARD